MLRPLVFSARGASVKSRTSTSTCMANGASGNARRAAAAAPAGSAIMSACVVTLMSSAATCARSKSVALVRVGSEEREPLRVQNGPGGEGARELVAAAGQVQRVGEAHPVQSALDGGSRGVHVEVAVDVEQPAAARGRHRGLPASRRRSCSCHRARAGDGRRSAAPACGRPAPGPRPRPDRCSGRTGRPGRAPTPARSGPLRRGRRCRRRRAPDQPRVAEGAGRLVLACGVAPGTARHADHRESAHDEGKSDGRGLHRRC